MARNSLGLTLAVDSAQYRATALHLRFLGGITCNITYIIYIRMLSF